MPTPTSNAVISKLADSISGLTEIVREWIHRSKWVSGALIVLVVGAVVMSALALRQGVINGATAENVKATLDRVNEVTDPTTKTGQWNECRTQQFFAVLAHTPVKDCGPRPVLPPIKKR